MIRKLQIADCNQVAQLHQSYLNTSFYGQPGKTLLALYYRAICREQGATGYVSVNQDNRIIGFVCGVWDSQQVRDALIRHSWAPLAFWGAMQVLIRPSLLMNFLSRYQAPKTPQDAKPEYELRPIVVAPEARGSGLANRLVQTLLQDAKQRGFSKICLFTEPDNLPANRFYQKFGFALAGETTRNGQIFRRYEYSTPNNA